jgi:crossover junction endodeoxyribonuclease RuvC
LRILGIDPGLSTTGYGIIEKKGNELELITYGGIRKSPKADFTTNLLAIYQKIHQIVNEFQPQACAVENIFYHQNKKTAIIMGHVRGVAMLAAAQNQLPVFEYSPKEVKLSIVGLGAASKPQVQAMVKNILHMTVIPDPEDAADALAVAICHYHRSKIFGMRKDFPASVKSSSKNRLKKCIKNI